MRTIAFNDVIADRYFIAWCLWRKLLDCFGFSALHTFNAERFEEVVHEFVV